MNKLSDRDMVLDLLMTEKHLAHCYSVTEAECSNQELREQLHTLHSSHEAQHSELFKEAHKRGWYDSPRADQAQIGQMIQAWQQRTQQDPLLNPGPARAGR